MSHLSIHSLELRFLFACKVSRQSLQLRAKISMVWIWDFEFKLELSKDITTMLKTDLQMYLGSCFSLKATENLMHRWVWIWVKISQSSLPEVTKICDKVERHWLVTYCCTIVAVPVGNLKRINKKHCNMLFDM